MSNYSITVSDGRVIGDSEFFRIADRLFNQEVGRLCAFTDALDRTPAQKKEQIAEYKCAKYRYAAVSLIHSTLYNNNRCRKLHNLASAHHLLLPFDEILGQHPDVLALYDAAPADEKPDVSLYYAMRLFAEGEIATLGNAMEQAGDWERIELEERIGGLQYACACLDEAWEQRGGTAK